MGVGERLLDKMKASICLLFCLYVPYVLSAAAGNDEGRKKRSADGYSNDYSTYYGAGPSAQYQTFGFGMAGQQPFHGKMRYGDPLSGERYKAWLAGQAMYGFRMRPMGPYLNRNHGHLQYLLQNGMYNQYQALRTPSNSLWKQYGFSLYGNAGNGKYTVPGQTRRKKRSTYGGYDNGGYGHGGYGNSGYGSGGYGNHYGGSGYGNNDYGGYGNNYGGSGYGNSYGDSGYGNNYGDSGYGSNYGGNSYSGNSYGSGYGNNYGDSGYGSNYGSGYGNNYASGGYGDNYGGGYGGSGYNDGGYGDNYGDNYGGYNSGGGYSGGGYNDGGYGTGYGGNYGGYGGGYGGYGGGHGGGYSRKKRSLHSPMIHGVQGYYGKGFQALANFAARGPWTYGGASGLGGYPGWWGHNYNSFPWTGSMFYSKNFNYDAYNLANILGKYSNRPQYS